MKSNTIKYMTCREAMEYLNVKSYRTLNHLAAAGLKIIDINGMKRIDKQDIDDFLAAKKK